VTAIVVHEQRTTATGYNKLWLFLGHGAPPQVHDQVIKLL
jgi:hypothetical protein